MNSPDEQVAENIIVALENDKLLSKGTLEKLKPKLIAGSISSTDWRLLFETDGSKKERA